MIELEKKEFREILDIWLTLQELETDVLTSNYQQHAELLCRKISIHAIAINALIDKIVYPSDYDVELKFLEPFSIWVLFRSVFEAYLAYSHIFLSPKNESERKIYYNAWMISGMKARQKVGAISQENRIKYKKEQKEIEDLINEIKKTSFFTKLNQSEGNKLLGLDLFGIDNQAFALNKSL